MSRRLPIPKIDEIRAFMYPSDRSMTHLVPSISLEPTTSPVAAWRMACVSFRLIDRAGGAPSS